MSKDYYILIIDDSNTNVVLLQAILQSKGYHTMTAGGVKEAYTVIGKQMPDLILLDLLMPEISGFDFLAEVRSREEMKNVPVIVVSALTDDIYVKKTMELGAVEFIKKPIDIQSMVHIVETTLKAE